MALFDFGEAFERGVLVAPEALGNEEGPDDLETFCAADNPEVFVDKLDVSPVFPVELNFDDDRCSKLGEENNGVGLSIDRPLSQPLIPRFDE